MRKLGFSTTAILVIIKIAHYQEVQSAFYTSNGEELSEAIKNKQNSEARLYGQALKLSTHQLSYEATLDPEVVLHFETKMNFHVNHTALNHGDLAASKTYQPSLAYVITKGLTERFLSLIIETMQPEIGKEVASRKQSARLSSNEAAFSCKDEAGNKTDEPKNVRSCKISTTDSNVFEAIFSPAQGYEFFLTTKLFYYALPMTELERQYDIQPNENGFRKPVDGVLAVIHAGLQTPLQEFSSGSDQCRRVLEKFVLKCNDHLQSYKPRFSIEKIDDELFTKEKTTNNENSEESVSQLASLQAVPDSYDEL